MQHQLINLDFSVVRALPTYQMIEHNLEIMLKLYAGENFINKKFRGIKTRNRSLLTLEYLLQVW